MQTVVGFVGKNPLEQATSSSVLTQRIEPVDRRGDLLRREHGRFFVESGEFEIRRHDWLRQVGMLPECEREPVKLPKLIDATGKLRERSMWLKLHLGLNALRQSLHQLFRSS